MISILVPLDGSKLAEEVFPCVEDLASRLHAEVRFLQVVDPRVESSIFAVEAGMVSQRIEENTKEAESYLTGIVDALASKGHRRQVGGIAGHSCQPHYRKRSTPQVQPDRDVHPRTLGAQPDGLRQRGRRGAAGVGHARAPDEAPPERCPRTGAIVDISE